MGVKNTNETAYIFYSVVRLRNPGCFTLMSTAMFSLERVGLALSFIKLTVENVDSHVQAVPNILKSFP